MCVFFLSEATFFSFSSSFFFAFLLPLFSLSLSLTLSQKRKIPSFGRSILDPAPYYGHHEAEFGMSWCVFGIISSVSEKKRKKKKLCRRRRFRFFFFFSSAHVFLSFSFFLDSKKNKQTKKQVRRLRPLLLERIPLRSARSPRILQEEEALRVLPYFESCRPVWRRVPGAGRVSFEGFDEGDVKFLLVTTDRRRRRTRRERRSPCFVRVFFFFSCEQIEEEEENGLNIVLKEREKKKRTRITIVFFAFQKSLFFLPSKLSSVFFSLSRENCILRLFKEQCRLSLQSVRASGERAGKRGNWGNGETGRKKEKHRKA